MMKWKKALDFDGKSKTAKFVTETNQLWPGFHAVVDRVFDFFGNAKTDAGELIFAKVMVDTARQAQALNEELPIMVGRNELLASKILETMVKNIMQVARLEFVSGDNVWDCCEEPYVEWERRQKTPIKVRKTKVAPRIDRSWLMPRMLSDRDIIIVGEVATNRIFGVQP